MTTAATPPASGGPVEFRSPSGAVSARAAQRNGLSPDEVEEVLLPTAVYAGVPAADTASAVAQEVLRREGTPETSRPDGGGEPPALPGRSPHSLVRPAQAT